MSLSLVLYARCKVNRTLYKVDLSEQSEKGFTLRPVDAINPQYKYIEATPAQLRNRELFQLFPMFRCQLEPAQVQVNA